MTFKVHHWSTDHGNLRFSSMFRRLFHPILGVFNLHFSMGFGGPKDTRQSVVVLFKSPGIQRLCDKNAFLLVLKVHVFLWFSGYLEDWGLARSYCSNPAPPGFIKTLSSSLQGFIYRCKIAPPIILLLVDDFNIAAKEDLFPKPSGQIFQEFLNLNYWHFGVHSLTITTKGWPTSWSL